MRITRPDAMVTIHRGRTHIVSNHLQADLREPLWLIHLNPALLLPGLRRKSRRIIYLEGRKCGVGEFRGGAIPLKCKRNRERYWSDHFENVLAEVLGICTHGRKRGYYRIKINDVIFIVDVHRNEKHEYHCMLYTKHNNDYIGDFIFTPTFDRVSVRLGVPRYTDSVSIVIGYVMDALLSIAVGRLTNSLEINY